MVGVDGMLVVDDFDENIGALGVGCDAGFVCCFDLDSNSCAADSLLRLLHVTFLGFIGFGEVLSGCFDCQAHPKVGSRRTTRAALQPRNSNGIRS